MISLANCPLIGDNSAKFISQGCGFIESVDLSGTKITLATTTHDLSGLLLLLLLLLLSSQTVFPFTCRDQSLRHLRKGCRNLNHLEILSCVNVTKLVQCNCCYHCRVLRYNCYYVCNMKQRMIEHTGCLFSYT